MSAAFDTLRIVRELEAVGVERRQAEAHAVADSARAESATKADLEATAATLASKTDLAGFATKTDLAGFATKADLAGFATKTDLAGFATKADLETAIAKLETRLRNDLATKGDLRDALASIRWAIGLLAAFVFAVGLRVFGLI